MRGAREDDWGHVDGDETPVLTAEQFQSASPGQPWLRNAIPPWHLWGSTERLVQQAAPGAGFPQLTQQLVKINYARPETWNFVFSLTLLDGPTAGALDTATLFAQFDVIVGVGRSAIIIPTFEQLTISWSNSAPPRGQQMFTTSVQSKRLFNQAPPAAPLLVRGSDIVNITAQDVQVVARVNVTPTPGLVGTTVTSEVSCHFAPQNHIRPDWYLHAPPEVQFPGSETGGR